MSNRPVVTLPPYTVTADGQPPQPNERYTLSHDRLEGEIDQKEVTNQAVKQFVDRGGYRDPINLLEDCRTLLAAHRVERRDLRRTAGR
jgi:hypothetical protein